MEKFVPSSARDGKIKYAAISAHKDDMEMFAFDGIVKAYDEGGFAGIVLTDGANCPRSADYADVGGEDMTALRSAEQKRAAEIGRYSELWLLDATSEEVKLLSDDVVSSVAEILRGFPRLDALYLHNPFDRHPTHVGAFVCAIKAVRMLKNEEKPRKIYACEVWRDLDWPSENDKVALDVGGKEFLAARLMDVFVSQNSVKRYDVAAQRHVQSKSRRRRDGRAHLCARRHRVGIRKKSRCGHRRFFGKDTAKFPRQSACKNLAKLIPTFFDVFRHIPRSRKSKFKP